MEIIILQIDTSTPVCSVAISLNGTTVAQENAVGDNMHAASLTHLISNLLIKASLSFDLLSAVSVVKGPGSYTGLRIGVSVAKGLCYALNCPLISVDALRMLCDGFRAHAEFLSLDGGYLLCPMIDARRMEVYQAVFTSAGKLLHPTTAAIINQDSFDWLDQRQRVLLFGSGADKFTDLFHSHPKVQVFADFKASASYLSQISYQYYLVGQFEDLAYFEPFYLKDFVPTTPKKRMI